MNNDVLGDICIASRTLSKCDDDHRKHQAEEEASRTSAAGFIRARSTRMDIAGPIRLIEETQSGHRHQPRPVFCQYVRPRSMHPTGAPTWIPPSMKSRTRSAKTRPGTRTTNGSARTAAGKGVTRHPRRRVRSGRRECLVRAWRQKPLRHDRHHRHHGRERRKPRQVFRHELRSRDQLPGIQESLDLDRPEMGRRKSPRIGQDGLRISRGRQADRCT